VEAIIIMDIMAIMDVMGVMMDIIAIAIITMFQGIITITFTLIKILKLGFKVRNKAKATQSV
jgi:hypothetical protein